MARVPKITNSTLSSTRNRGGASSNAPVRAQYFNDLVVDYISASQTGLQTIAGSMAFEGTAVFEENVQIKGVTVLEGPVYIPELLTVSGGFQEASVAVNATADPLDGVIPDNVSKVKITSTSSTDEVTLPAALTTATVHIVGGNPNGYELRTSNNNVIGINGAATGGDDYASIAAGTPYVRCVSISPTLWICTQFSADGTESKVVLS